MDSGKKRPRRNLRGELSVEHGDFGELSVEHGVTALNDMSSLADVLTDESVEGAGERDSWREMPAFLVDGGSGTANSTG